LLCKNDTDVEMLIMNKMWRKQLKHFYGLLIFFIIICEHVYICNDIDSRQNMEKATRTFLRFTNEVIYLFRMTKNRNRDCNFHASEQHSENFDTIHLSLTTIAKFYYL
jgi:hypothetical protein